MNGKEFSETITSIYNEIVKWRKNLFMIPTGKASKEFLTELATWLNHYNRGSAFQGIAMKVFFILPSLLMQKQSRASKAKEHISKLAERLSMWKDGELDKLMIECRYIQKNLQSSKRRLPEDTARIFGKLILQGKMKAAVKMLSSDADAAF
jgi:hypothetical protein